MISRLLAPIGKVCLASLAPLLEVLVVILLWPLAFVLWLLFVVVDLVATPFVVWCRRRPAPATGPVAPRRSASIIIVSWNGKDFLSRLLPSLFEAIDYHGGDHEVIVVDNGSTDDSIEFIKGNFPRTRIVALPENRFFVRGNMAGVAVATRDTLLFLNNDMIVKRDFLGPLLDGFTSDDVFGVAAEVFFRDPNKRREETGKTTGRLRGGFLHLAHRMPTPADTHLGYTPTFWAGGGSSAFDRKKFLEIGGWDLTFDPFYLEDAGLSFQAWKRGWQVVFTPRSGVFHEHRGTSRKLFGDDYIEGVVRRNQHLFLWRNVTSPVLTAKYFALLPFGILARAARSHRTFGAALAFELRALARALPRLPIALWRRTASRPAYQRTDEQVVALANHNRRLAFATGKVQPGPRLRILMLFPRLPRLNTDGSWTVFHRLRELSQRHDVSVFSLLDEPGEEAKANELRAFCKSVTTFVRRHEPSIADPHRLIPWRLRRDYSIPALYDVVREQIETGDYDIVQAEYIEMAHLASPFIDGVPAVYGCHEPHNLLLARQRERAKGLLAKLVAWFEYVQGTQHEIRYTRAFRHCWTLSAVDQRNLEELVPGLRVRTINFGADLRHLHPPPGHEPDPGAIVFIAYFKHPPNADAALWLAQEILPRVRAQEPAATVYFVGRDPPEAVQAQSGTNGIVTTGFVDDLAPYLRRASIIVAPIRLGGGLRGKVLEAWASGRPLVATTIATEGFVAVDGEHLLLADDAPAFADAIVRLLRDRELRRRLAAAGLHHAEQRYSITATIRQYEELYREMLGQRQEFVPGPAIEPAGEMRRV